MNKLDKLNLILKLIKEHNLTAYEIGKNTKISTFAIQKIINGDTKNPNETTIDAILIFIEKAITGTDIKINSVEEPTPEYKKNNPEEELKSYHECLRNNIRYVKEIMRLSAILRKNNIEFDDNFEI